MEKKYYVYIIYSASHDLYYKGSTTNIDLRLGEHNESKSRYTANKGPWELVFIQSYEDKTQALKRERTLKKYSHDQIKVLINSKLNELG